jgi:hypothetical protein
MLSGTESQHSLPYKRRDQTVLHRREPSRECLTPILDPGIKLIRTLDEPDELFGVQVDLKTLFAFHSGRLREKEKRLKFDER